MRCLVCLRNTKTHERRSGVVRYRICDDCEEQQRKHGDERAQRAVEQAEKAGI